MFLYNLHTPFVLLELLPGLTYSLTICTTDWQQIYRYGNIRLQCPSVSTHSTPGTAVRPATPLFAEDLASAELLLMLLLLLTSALTAASTANTLTWHQNGYGCDTTNLIQVVVFITSAKYAISATERYASLSCVALCTLVTQIAV